MAHFDMSPGDTASVGEAGGGCLGIFFLFLFVLMFMDANCGEKRKSNNIPSKTEESETEAAEEKESLRESETDLLDYYKAKITKIGDYYLFESNVPSAGSLYILVSSSQHIYLLEKEQNRIAFEFIEFEAERLKLEYNLKIKSTKYPRPDINSIIHKLKLNSLNSSRLFYEELNFYPSQFQTSIEKAEHLWEKLNNLWDHYENVVKD
jgi:hypothetical protein